jgi:hypothetical protein
MPIDLGWKVHGRDAGWDLFADLERQRQASLDFMPCEHCPRTERCKQLRLACTALKQYLLRRPSHIAARVDASHERYIELGLDKRKGQKWPPKR